MLDRDPYAGVRLTTVPGPCWLIQPLRFRFRIPDHGVSDVMTVFILFGE